MTIRFTKSWNGYYEGQIVTNPAGGNTEAQLIALGYAVSDLDGPDNSFELAKFATDTTGNVTGLVGPGGVVAAHLNPTQRTLLCIGDSRSNGVVTATAADITGTRLVNHMWQNWYKVLSKRRHRIVSAGRSSRTALQLATNDTSSSALDTLKKSVIDPVAQDALIWIGINDLSAGSSGASICNSIRTIAAAARGSGKAVAVILEMPKTGFALAHQYQLFELQHALQEYSALGEFGLIDITPRLIDWANTTNYSSLTAYQYDGLHPNAAGAKIIAEAVDAYYSALYPSAATDFPSHHYLDDSSVYSGATNRIANGLFATALTGWTVPTVTGAVTAVTTTRIAAPDGYGYALACDITVNAATTVSICSRAYDAGTGFVAGDTLQATARFWIQGNGGTGTATGVVSPYLRCDINTTGGMGAGRTVDMWPENTTAETAQATNFDGLLETLPYYWTGLEGNLSASLSCGMRFSGAGSARIIFSRIAAKKNAANYANGEWVIS